MTFGLYDIKSNND